MPPPTMRWSTLPASTRSTSSLVETLDPPTMATVGGSGRSNAAESASSSRTSSGPAQATAARRATPWVLAWARWAEAKASMTKMSHSPASRAASPSSLAFSPRRNRTFSRRTACPGATSTPCSQESTRGIGRPSNSPRRRATGPREKSSLNRPSSGRPRWDIRITHAPCSRANSTVGRAARRRASLATFPSLIGVFRSSRISTRRPARERSTIRSTRIVYRPLWRPTGTAKGTPARASVCNLHLPNSSQPTLANASAVSSMRFEKPHSLSYQAQTFTRLPATLVRLASNTDEAGSWLKSMETRGSSV